ncbi:MAG: hypothetical protein INQ03_06180 [Candidatus Heimdallarchaeota archaeon]|nr:hypothetical protein [Candidatus Heimdallarchaeota archaeon]
MRYRFLLFTFLSVLLVSAITIYSETLIIEADSYYEIHFDVFVPEVFELTGTADIAFDLLVLDSTQYIFWKNQTSFTSIHAAYINTTSFNQDFELLENTTIFIIFINHLDSPLNLSFTLSIPSASQADTPYPLFLISLCLIPTIRRIKSQYFRSPLY